MPNRQVRAKASQFRGLNNARDPRRLQTDWLTTGKNVDVQDDGTICRRPGASLVEAGTFRAAYVTYDDSHMYVASAGQLYSFAGGGLTSISSDLTPAYPVRFSEINGRVYVLNGPVKRVVQGLEIRPWGLPVPTPPSVDPRGGALPAGDYEFAVSFRAPDGRESGLSARTRATLSEPGSWRLAVPQEAGLETLVYMATAGDSVLYRVGTTTQPTVDVGTSALDLGVTATTEYRVPPPDGEVLAFSGGRALVGAYHPDLAMSVIWRSDPLSYELFTLDEGFLAVPGQLRMLFPVTGGLVIGTNREIMFFDGEELRTVLNYGVPHGVQGYADDEGMTMFWSLRGLVVVGPEGFQNLMDRVYSPEKTMSANAAIVQQNGYRKFIALTRQRGAPYNAWRNN